MHPSVESLCSEPKGILPTVEDFVRDAAEYPVVPVWIELVADSETPLSILLKIGSEDPSFLLESAEQNDLVGLLSIIGSGARAVITSHGNQMTLTDRHGVSQTWDAGDPLEELEQLMGKYRCKLYPELPGFIGGAVGYLGYEGVSRFEPSIPAAAMDDLGVPDMLFLIADTVVLFDHKARRIKVVACAFPGELGVEESRTKAIARIALLLKKLARPMAMSPFPAITKSGTLPVTSNFTREEFEKSVEQCKEYIRAGDIFQIVLSQRFRIPYEGDPVHLYRALRFINPSPYMFCLRLPGGFSLVGSSPEVHVKVTEGRVQIRPIAGTRRRGATPEADEALASELLDDPKERAEHLMLVDLARNDVGRISEFGSVSLTDFMTVERYSHVMHIVSNVVGRLSGKHSPWMS